MTRKRSIKTLSLALLLCLLLAMGAAAVGDTAITAQLSPQVEIVVDGVERTFYTVDGVQAHPISYQGTTYLPVRAIGELMGKNVNWDQASYTVTLAGERTTPATAGTPDTGAVSRSIAAQLRPDFTIVVDGSVRTFRDANGTVVYPLLYNGSTYLPVRAIGEIMGKRVGWNGATGTVTLTTPGGSLVTDADTFEPTGQPGQGAGQTGRITAEQAKAAALSHAGLTAEQVTFLTCQLDYDDGRLVYDVEFYTGEGREYDYEIDAATGAIVSFDYDAEHARPSTGTGGANLISAEQARAIALARVPGAAVANTRKVHLDWDYGRAEYEVEILYGGWEYEFEIDAVTGQILSWDRDR